MIKLLILILLVWIITKIINYFSFISSTKQDTSKKTSKDRKTMMDIVDADYEEVE